MSWFPSRRHMPPVFVQHERIARELGADYFFAHPCASWKRGTNENMNGLILQLFPKKKSFDSITPEAITFAVEKLNR